MNSDGQPTAGDYNFTLPNGRLATTGVIDGEQKIATSYQLVLDARMFMFVKDLPSAQTGFNASAEFDQHIVDVNNYLDLTFNGVIPTRPSNVFAEIEWICAYKLQYNPVTNMITRLP
jgi:hypothetical protein